MSMTQSDTLSFGPADADLVRRVQLRNQEDLSSKLLHDLRNPVHSMRITVELFSRVAEAGADSGALLTRAARYVEPAQAALAALIRQTERITLFLAAPREPAMRAVPVGQWLTELVELLQCSAGVLELQVGGSLEKDQALLADHSRLTHAALRWTLDHAAGPTVLRAHLREGLIQIEVTCAPQQAARHPSALQGEALGALIEAAGGTLVRETREELVLSFKVAQETAAG
jgi:hypothetical protein